MSLRAVLAALIVGLAPLATAAPAFAQATTGTGPAGDKAGLPTKKGDRPAFPPAPTAPPVPAEEPKAEPEPPPTPEQAVSRALEAWPAPEARDRARALAARYGEPDVRAAILGLLRRRPVDVRLASAAAFVAAEAGDGEVAGDLSNLLRDRTLWSRAGDVMDALVRLDASRANARLLALLDVPSTVFLAQLAQVLAPRLAPADLPALLEAAARPLPSTRRTALTLAADLDGVAARPALEAALADPSAEVAATAALLLSAATDEAAGTALNALARGPGDRRAAFAALALTRAAERTGESPLEPGTVAALIGSRGLRSADPAVRILAAICLADVGYLRPDPAVDPLLEKEIVPVLVEAVAGLRFFSDLPALRPLALERLLRLTEGTGGLRTAPEWGAWWESHRDGFVARRVLTTIAADGVASFRISVAGSSTGPAGTGTFAADGAGAPPTGGARGAWIVLSAEERTRLVAAVVAAGVLAAPEAYGSDGAEGALSLEVGAGHRRRRVRWGRAEAIPGEVGALLDLLGAIRAANGWQSLWDRTVASTFEGFVEAEGPFWRGDAGEPARAARWTALSVGAARDAMDEAHRAEILEALVAAPGAEPRLTAEHAAVLASFAAVGDRLGRSGVAALRVLAAARRTEGLSPLRMLMGRPADAGLAEPILVETLARVPAEAAVAAAADGASPGVQRAALAALSRREDARGFATEAVRVALRSDDGDVRGAALRALGTLRTDDALTLLTGAVGTESDPAALEGALEGLGALGGAAVLPHLGRALHSPEARTRAAAVRGLAATGEPEGLSMVLAMLQGEADPAVRASAEEAVRATGGERARELLRSLALDGRRDAEARLRAVEGLGVLGAEPSAADLRGLLSDPVGVVADSAALVLGWVRDGAAAPRLLDALREGRQTARVLRCLEVLSLESFRGARDRDEMVRLYTGWHRVMGERGPRGWLADALAARGHGGESLQAFGAGGDLRAAVPVLLEAWPGADWYLRRALDLELRRASGRSVGDVDPWTSDDEVARMLAAWREWWSTARPARR